MVETMIDISEVLGNHDELLCTWLGEGRIFLTFSSQENLCWSHVEGFACSSPLRIPCAQESKQALFRDTEMALSRGMHLG